MPLLRVFTLVVVAAAAGLIGEAVADGAPSCALGPNALRTHFDLRSPKIAKVVRTRRQIDDSNRIFEQTVRLTSGRTVTFAVYGCNHYGYRFSFRPLPGATSSTPLPALARIALEQLASVPILQAERTSVTYMQDILSSDRAITEAEGTGGGNSPYHLSSEFGDAHYTLNVPEPGVLEIEYDFAL